MNSKVISLLALVFVLFLDGLGQGIIFPVLGHALTQSHSLLAPNFTLPTREFLYGAIIGVFFLCWFFGAAILGDISDNIGRKKALIITLSGIAIGNFISAIAFFEHSLILMFIGRIVVGFTAGSQAIAQAAIMDISEPDKQARNIGIILFGVALGLTLGPALGGVLSDPTVVSWFGQSTPFYITALLAILNISALLVFFHETRVVVDVKPIKLTRAIYIFVDALRRRGVRYIVLVFALLQFGWATFYLQSPLYMAVKFLTVGNVIAVYMTVLGLALSIGLLVIPRYLEKFSAKQVALWGYVLFVVGTVIFFFIPNFWLKCVIAFIATTSMAGGFAFIVKLLGAQASENEQGWIMGIQNSTMVMATGIASLVGGLLIGGAYDLTVFNRWNCNGIGINRLIII